MGVVDHLALGFATALTPAHLLACFAGTALGTVIGVLPGLGPVTTIAILLPITFSLPPTAAIIMLAGIYYGAQYGGSIAAILVNLPGEASSSVTCLDGHAMARNGRARVALAVSAVGSFVGGTVGTMVIAALSVPLASVASSFAAADYAALMVCGLVVAVVIAGGAVWKALAMTGTGLLLGAVGTDVATGAPRFTFGIPELFDGISFVALAIGLFAFADAIESLASGSENVFTAPPGQRFWSDAREPRRAAAAAARGTVVGSLLGVLPGGGPLIASFAAYAVEKRFASSGPPLGTGAIEGVAGPEAANNAAAQTSFVPLLTLGLPANAVMALLLGALVVHGIRPGPDFVADQPALFWGLVASMWIGNAMLLILNLPFVGLWARLLMVRHTVLYPVTVALSCTGIYAVNHSTVDLWVAALFGIVGYALKTVGFKPAPLLLGFVLSKPLEENLSRALVFGDGDMTTFLRHPISAVLLAVAGASLVFSAAEEIRRQRR